LVEERVREHVPWNRGISLVSQAEQSFAKRDLVRGLVKTLED
jgi:hypothetical protein